MKKKIVSLLLVAVMLICAIPAISLVSYADDANEPKVGTYEYYEHLWYDDGHLLSFVDLMNITDEQRADRHAKQLSYDEKIGLRYQVNLHDGNYRIINGYSASTSFDRNYGRSYIKIIGGENAGKWYMITTKSNSTNTFPTVAGGFTDFADTQGSGAYIAGFGTGIIISRPFSEKEAGNMLSFTLSYTETTLVGDSYMLPAANGGNAFTVDASVYIGENTLQYPYSVFLSSYTAISSTGTDMFEGTSNEQSKQTESSQQHSRIQPTEASAILQTDMRDVSAVLRVRAA